eukprot:15476211-Alexandrium_andersonii.AAC.1
MASVRERVVATWTAKFGFWEQVPYKMLGVFASLKAPIPAAKCKEVARAAREQYDAVPNPNSLNRVCHVFLRPGSQVRSQWLEFEASEESLLTDYPELCLQLCKYALAPITERSVEGEHAKVHKLLQHPGKPQLPPAVCAQLRHVDADRWMRDKSFMAWSDNIWKSRSIFTSLLQFEYSGTELQAMSQQEVIQRIYCFRPDIHFKDRGAGKQ